MTEIVKINYCRRILIQVSLIAALVIMLGLAAESSFAAQTTYGDYTVENVRGSNTAKIIRYNGNDSDLVFPDSDLSEPIEFNQYIKASSITAVEIELTEAQKKSIKSVTVPEGYTSISGFGGASGLETINIPTTVTSLSANSFKDCTGLKNVNFAEGSTGIRLFMNTFGGCTSLKTIVLPEGSTTLNNINPFAGCSALESIEMTGNGDFFTEDGILFNRDGTNARLITYPEGKLTTSSTLPEKAGEMDVVSTGMHTLRGASNLEEVIIPASYKTVGNYALNGCKNLKKITIKSEEFSIDGNYSYAFQDIAENSVIYVATEEIKAALEANTGCYTQGRTTFEVIADEGPSRFDVNGDGTVDMLDMTTAQMYYQVKSTDEGWETASKADMNVDNQIDVQDLILIYSEIYKAQ